MSGLCSLVSGAIPGWILPAICKLPKLPTVPGTLSPSLCLDDRAAMSSLLVVTPSPSLCLDGRAAMSSLLVVTPSPSLCLDDRAAMSSLLVAHLATH